MSELQQRLYEGMFLVDPAATSASIGEAAKAVRHILDRAETNVEALYKWDDRRLAYPIEGQKRGIYLIALFRAPGSAVGKIENDVNFSETILRCLVTRGDHIGEAELELAKQSEKETMDAASLEAANAEKAAAAAEAPAPEPAAATAAAEAPQEAESTEETASN